MWVMLCLKKFGDSEDVVYVSVFQMKRNYTEHKNHDFSLDALFETHVTTCQIFFTFVAEI
jgi:hypothetical protein